MIWKQRQFLSRIDHDRIVRAIGEAERATSGQIRLCISHRRVGDPVAAAEKHFHRLGLAATEHRNAVFLFIAPLSRKFAVLGDAGIHGKAGDAAWSAIGETLAGHFRKGAFTEGLLHAISRAGDLLAAHYPAASGTARNALPDDIESD
jgi:uncharacterized membrane protein